MIGLKYLLPNNFTKASKRWQRRPCCGLPSTLILSCHYILHYIIYLCPYFRAYCFKRLVFVLPIDVMRVILQPTYIKKFLNMLGLSLYYTMGRGWILPPSNPTYQPPIHQYSLSLSQCNDYEKGRKTETIIGKIFSKIHLSNIQGITNYLKIDLLWEQWE